MDATFVTATASILVASVAAASAYASQRAAAKATTTNTNTTSRVDMEREAYDRARAFDTETIRRQDAELEEIRVREQRLTKQVKTLTDDNENLRRQVRALVTRITRLEREHVSPTPEEIEGVQNHE